jgi:uncharacterized iron-regulated membrane protein
MPSTVSSLPSHVEAHRSRHRGLLDAEAFRVAGAVVALVASALLLTGGLLWRERARAREAPQAIEAPLPDAAAASPRG